VAEEEAFEPTRAAQAAQATVSDLFSTRTRSTLGTMLPLPLTETMAELEQTHP